MGSNEEQSLQPPNIDFRGLDPAKPAGPEWDLARAGVMAALESYGCFNAIYNGVGPELKEALFERSLPEMFALPLEVKQRNTSGTYVGYIGQITDVPYESLRVQDATDPEKLERFVQTLWPEGNPAFCNTASNFTQRVVPLEQMITRMIFQSLGIEKYCDSHLQSLCYGVRLASYGELQDQETKIALKAHRDPNLTTIICQHKVEGLDVQTKDGHWIRVLPSPGSFTVMTGEAYTVLTNGRFIATTHCVSVDKKRYTAIIGSFPKEGYLIETPKELVDEEHPLQYNPIDVAKYTVFKHSLLGKNVDMLNAFCGVGAQKIEA